MYKRKKSQVQMGETLAILLVFFFLLIIGMVFYVKIIKAKYSAEKEENEQLEAVVVLKRALSLPELLCSRQNIAQQNCIDLLKLESSSSIIEKNNEYFFDALGFSTITVLEVYPSLTNHTFYSFPLDDFRSKSVANVPILLLDPSTDRKSFGIVTVETYAR